MTTDDSESSAADAAIQAAVETLRAGGVVGLPTETVYGLAADGLQPAAVRKIFEIKGRPSGHPLILHLGDASWLERFTPAIPSAARQLAAAFWPGPLTMIVQRSEAVPSEVTGGLSTVALRMPAHPVALAVIRRLGRPVAAPSANRFGSVSPTTRQHVLDDLGGDVPIVLEGGACDVGVESTIVDLTRETPRVLRPGAISRGQLADVLGGPVAADDGAGPAAPGTLASHYAPRARVEIVAHDQVLEVARRLSMSEKAGVIRAGTVPAELPSRVEVVSVDGGSAALAQELYAALRHLDELGCTVIVSSFPPPEGIGEAVADRLRRAAAPR